MNDKDKSVVLYCKTYVCVNIGHPRHCKIVPLKDHTLYLISFVYTIIIIHFLTFIK